MSSFSQAPLCEPTLNHFNIFLCILYLTLLEQRILGQAGEFGKSFSKNFCTQMEAPLTLSCVLGPESSPLLCNVSVK